MLNAVTAICFDRWITSDKTKPCLVVGAAADYEGSDRLLQDPMEDSVMTRHRINYDIKYRLGQDGAEEGDNE
jgi:hypothetical protein